MVRRLVHISVLQCHQVIISVVGVFFHHAGTVTQVTYKITPKSPYFSLFIRKKKVDPTAFAKTPLRAALEKAQAFQSEI